jgi:hypothetical protein
LRRSIAVDRVGFVDRPDGDARWLAPSVESSPARDQAVLTD